MTRRTLFATLFGGVFAGLFGRKQVNPIWRGKENYKDWFERVARAHRIEQTKIRIVANGEEPPCQYKFAGLTKDGNEELVRRMTLREKIANTAFTKFA